MLHHKVNNWDYYLNNDISKHNYWKNGYRSFYDSIERHDGGGEEFRNQWLHETCHRGGQQFSQTQAPAIWSGSWQKLNLVEMLSRTPFPRVNSMQSSSSEATMDKMHRWQWWEWSWVNDSTLSMRKVECHFYKSIKCDHQSENEQSMAQSYSCITNTVNRRRSTEMIESQHIVYTYNSSNREEAEMAIITTKAIGRVQNSGDKKCNFWVFISDPVQNTPGNSNDCNMCNPGNSKSVKLN